MTGSDCATGFCDTGTRDDGFGKCRLANAYEFCDGDTGGGGVFNPERGETVRASALARGLNCSCSTFVGAGTLVDVATAVEGEHDSHFFFLSFFL